MRNKKNSNSVHADEGVLEKQISQVNIQTTEESPQKSNSLAFMNKMNAMLARNVSNELGAQSRKLVNERLNVYSNIEKKQLEKLRNNIDDKMEAKELQQEVFLSQEQVRKPAEKIVKSKLAKTRTKAEAIEQYMVKMQQQQEKDSMLAKETDKQRATRIKREKIERAKADREANKEKRSKMKKVTMYGVLGLDSIIPKDDMDITH